MEVCIQFHNRYFASLGMAHILFVGVLQRVISTLVANAETVADKINTTLTTNVHTEDANDVSLFPLTDSDMLVSYDRLLSSSKKTKNNLVNPYWLEFIISASRH